MTRVDFKAIAAEMAKNALSKAELDARIERQSRNVHHERAQRLHRSGGRGAILPEDFDAICSDALTLNTHALQHVRGWHAARAQGDYKWRTVLALVGDKGRGKTVAALWLLAQIGGTYATAADLCRWFHSGLPTERSKYDDAIAQRVLIVDDLGTEEKQHNPMGMLFGLVNARAGIREGWTVLTANLTEPEFNARYDERTRDRIRHMGALVMVEGEDLRRRS